MSQEIFDGHIWFVREQAAGQHLRTRDRFMNGADANVAAVKLDNHIAAVFKAYRLADIRRQADTARRRNTPATNLFGMCSHKAITRLFANTKQDWRKSQRLATSISWIMLFESGSGR